MTISFDFTGHVALVTGASAGMGLAAARAFAEAGASTVLADINETAVRAAADELARQGHDVLSVACDVSDEAQVATAVATTMSTYGKLDAAFNNAGNMMPGSVRSAYTATKHAVLALTKSTALEEGSHGIRVNAVCPGTIETPMVDRMIAAGELDGNASAAASAIPRLGRADEIAAAVLWLCSPGASYVTGVALPVDGGLAAA
jgi:NAD(P)-dependent dehydrogenase (short-subunit alcohol dehydrogenase family)